MSLADNRPADFATIRIGDALPAQTWTAEMEDLLAFGDLLYPPRPDDPNRSTNPHVNEAYAKDSMYGGLFVDGNQTVAFLCRMITDWLPPASLLAGFSNFDLRFPNPCRLGEVVTFSGIVAGKATEDGRDMVFLDVRATTQAGKVVATGKIDVHVPRPQRARAPDAINPAAASAAR